jgi:hypothetical protein
LRGLNDRLRESHEVCVMARHAGAGRAR